MNQLGISPILLLAQIINFSILFFILYRVLFKIILEGIRKREEKETETKKLQGEIEAKWQNVEKLKREKLAEIRKEGSQILKQAKDEAEKEKEVILTKAKKEANEIIQEAKSELGREKKKMEERLKRETTNLAVKIAEKVVANIIDKEKQKTLIDRAISNLKTLSFRTDSV